MTHRFGLVRLEDMDAFAAEHEVVKWESASAVVPQALVVEWLEDTEGEPGPEDVVRT